MTDHASAAGTSARIRVGIGGWTFAPWRSNFYPDGLIQRRELEYASRHLRAIEINGTFYRAQKPEVYAKWAAETPAGFVFSLKAPRYLTHHKTWAGVREMMQQFVHGGLAELGDRLGPILWQLPSSHVFEVDGLAAFLDALPATLNGHSLQHVLEVRHRSFACDEYVALARSARIATVFTDAADYPAIADLTGDFAYARLRCSEEKFADGYAAQSLSQWAKRARQWADGKDIKELPHIASALLSGKPRDVFVFFINSAKQRNPAAAMALQRRVDSRQAR